MPQFVAVDLKLGFASAIQHLDCNAFVGLAERCITPSAYFLTFNPMKSLVILLSVKARTL